MSGRRGLTLLETLVAVVVLAVGVTALQRLVLQSVRGIAEDGRLTRAALLAETLLAEAALAPPEPGHSEGRRADGLRFERDVARTAHPALREIRVRVVSDGGERCELVELIRVPAA